MGILNNDNVCIYSTLPVKTRRNTESIFPVYLSNLPKSVGIPRQKRLPHYTPKLDEECMN